MSMNVSDAAVALAGFSRRYAEVLSGPRGDDAWDRLTRTVPHGQHRSPLGWVTLATALLDALASLSSALPTTKSPSLSVTDVENSTREPNSDVSIDDVLRGLAAAGSAAATTVKARSHDDVERQITLNGTGSTYGHALEHVVQTVAANIRRIEAAIEANR